MHIKSMCSFVVLSSQSFAREDKKMIVCCCGNDE